MNHADTGRKKAQAVWIAHALFDRGKTTGTTANISFRHGDSIWISRSGACFGTLQKEDLVETGPDGAPRRPDAGRPSKETPLHLALYDNDAAVQAVLHVHSPGAVLWSCLPQCTGRDVIPRYTPYLQMKLGSVAAVPYAPPGSPALFAQMRQALGPERGYLLCNHGSLVGGLNLMNAFEAAEELEQAAWLAFQLLGRPGCRIME